MSYCCRFCYVLLWIGGQVFRVGMPQQEAMALIAKCCTTQGDPEDGLILIQKTGGAFKQVGDVFFKNGPVSQLRADVTQIETKDVSDFVLALYRSVLNGQTQARGVVTIEAFPFELTNATDRMILLTYPDGRRLRITQFSVDNGSVGAHIEEER